MHIEFKGKTVIVTGAAHGIGRAIAKSFVTGGAHVFACDVNVDRLEETKRICGKSCETVLLDVGDQVAVQTAVSKIEKARSGVDILVNNAGGVCEQVGRPIEEISALDWQTIFDVNLSGTFFMSQAAAVSMKRQKYGRIVNISSGAGRTVSLTGIQAYASAKAGQIGLTRQLSHELGDWNITVNCIAPGFILSNPTTEKQWEAMGDSGKEKLLSNIALHRLGKPDDIANAVMFFASEHASWITGETLGVDGGK
ncbi:MAG: SDR family NAD(P)-dependent oxidoreductase [Paracoccaceae bacterium]